MTADESPICNRRTLLQSLGVSAVTTGLAGCSESLRRRYIATPVVLTQTAIQGFSYPEPSYDRVVTERSASVGPLDGSAVVESFVFKYGTGQREELTTEWPRGESPPVGVLSTPRIEEGGQVLNPLASKPLDQIVAGPRMKALLTRVGILEQADVQWRAPLELADSRQIQLFEDEQSLQRYIGVLEEGDSPGRVVRVDATRGSHEDDAVLAATGEQRTLTSAEGDALAGSDCETIDCLDEKLTFEARAGIAEQITRNLIPCPVNVEQAKQRNVDLDNCLKVSGGGDGMEFLHLDLTEPRVVQQVDETVVSGVSPTYTAPDPSVVDGENAAVVFNIGTGAVDTALSDWDTNVQVDIVRRFKGGKANQSDRFFIPNTKAKAIINGKDPVVVFHHLAASSDSATDPTVFPADIDLDSVHVSITSQDDDNLQWSVIGDDTTLEAGPKADFNVEAVQPLRVGFLFVVDPDGGKRYGNNNGYPRDYERTWESATEYLQRVYPGDVVSYLHTVAPFYGGHEQSGFLVRNCTGTCAIHQDMVEARNWLNSVVSRSGFPGNGRLDLDGVDRSKVNWSGGFDVVVAIVPGVATQNSSVSDYYDYFGQDANVLGLAFSDPNAAVSSIGVVPSGNDARISATVAQEIGHYFQDDYGGPAGHPMAQRNDVSVDTTVNNIPVDTSHARHPNSDLRDRDTNNDGSIDVNNPPDSPGVVSMGYDLTNGFANLQSYTNKDGAFSITGPSSSATSAGNVPSYMSYTPNADKAWGDARIHQQLIDSGWSPPGTSGGGNTTHMLSATGHVTESGSIRYDNVATLPGRTEYTTLDGAPVKVELLHPDGKTLAQARVPVEVASTHGNDEPAVAPSFTLPFVEEGVRVRTTYEGQAVGMNPIERSIRDAIARVPDDGVDDPETTRESIGELLDDVAAAMADQEYKTAADILDGPVRKRIQESIGTYDRALNVPTPHELMDLVDEMVERLRTIAETSG